MSLSNEISKLQDLRDRGVLTEDEFAQAKARVISAAPAEAQVPQSATLDAHLQTIQFQNELARLDREWEMEQEKYVVRGRYGTRRAPNAGAGLLAALVVGGFGLFWTITAASMGAPVFFPIFGVIFILIGVGAGITETVKAGEYQQAQQQYQQRRNELLARHDVKQR